MSKHAQKQEHHAFKVHAKTNFTAAGSSENVLNEIKLLYHLSFEESRLHEGYMVVVVNDKNVGSFEQCVTCPTIVTQNLVSFSGDR